jgi:hypothetical protein
MFDPPHLLEVTADNERVWQWGGQMDARDISNVYVVR